MISWLQKLGGRAGIQTCDLFQTRQATYCSIEPGEEMWGGHWNKVRPSDFLLGMENSPHLKQVANSL